MKSGADYFLAFLDMSFLLIYHQNTSMKKLIEGCLGVFLLFLLVSPILAATDQNASDSSTIYNPPVPLPTTNQVINGMPYPTTVYPPNFTPGVYLLAIFDKKGSTQVGAKIIFDETDKDLMRNFSFLIPGKDVSLIRIVHEQQVLKNQCPQDIYLQKPMPMMQQLPLQTTPASPPKDGVTINNPPYYCPQNYVSVFTTINPKTEPAPGGLKITLSANPVLNDKTQDSFLILYRTNSYTSRVLSNYYYNLPTPRLPTSQATAQIGIFVKDGLRLRGSNQYGGMGTYIPSLRALEKARNLKREENQELSMVSNDIMYQGMVRKSDSDIGADASFVASGVYGSVGILLYMREIGIALAVLFAIGVMLFFILRAFLNRHSGLRMVILTVFITMIATALLTVLVLFSFLFLRSQGMGPIPL